MSVNFQKKGDSGPFLHGIESGDRKDGYLIMNLKRFDEGGNFVRIA